MGFSLAAFRTCINIESVVKSIIKEPEIKNIVKFNDTLYSKLFSHKFIAHQDIGMAIINAIKMGLREFSNNSLKILKIEAPNTFRMPISFVFC